MTRYPLILSLIFLFPLLGHEGNAAAQGSDPVLAGMILMYTEKAITEYEQQQKVMLLESTGHVWVKEGLDTSTDLKKEFNRYLDSFHAILSYAAQVYGFYHEIDRMAENLTAFSSQVSSHSGNALAVALSENRSNLYREFLMGSVEIVNDVRIICLSDIKMTEEERLDMVLGIRPKLRSMNRTLQRLTRAVRYTDLADVWADIEGNTMEMADKEDIARRSFERWRDAGKQ